METLTGTYHPRSDVPEKSCRVNDAMMMTAPATVAGVLEHLPPDVRRVYLTGKEPGGGGIVNVRRWAQACGDSWSPQGDQYVSLSQPRLTYRHKLTGRVVYVLRAAPWFGDDATPDVAAGAWEALEESLSRAWNFRTGRAGEWRPVRLYGTPATTGRLLLERQWAETGRTFEPLALELQQLIRDTSSQGRFELGPAAEVGAPGGLWVYDAAFMYASCAAELPTGPVHHDHGHEVEPYVRGRYRVQFMAPRSWHHIGMFGVRDEPGGPLSYPADSSRWHETWADACEVQLAREYGWKVRPVERLLWRERSARPLDTWARRLVKAREAVSVLEGSDALEPVAKAMRFALRAILVQTIGALTGTPRKVTRTAPLEAVASLPDGAGVLELPSVQGGEWTWTEAAPPAFESMQHPEWSAHTWAKARSRLLSDTHGAGALRVPPGELYALALDSIATTAPVPEWTDRGRIGEFRLTQRKHGPVPPAATLRDYYAMTGEPA